ncbi:hypothetical protein V5O48_016073 [Marasmius crinis-equi]|uniref:Uncharacterized protein n=1 Tax=Marasmius crinis-equi TaxID=585013 RepID=A0ABR3ESS1_9AGAR
MVRAFHKRHPRKPAPSDEELDALEAQRNSRPSQEGDSNSDSDNLITVNVTPPTPPEIVTSPSPSPSQATQPLVDTAEPQLRRSQRKRKA